MLKPLAALCLACTLALAACSNDSSPSTPTQPTNVAGTWVGNVTVAGTSARMTWTLSQTGTTVNGPVLLGLANGTVLLNGALTGTISGNSLTYSIAVAPGGIPLQPACSGQITGTMAVAIASTSTLTGTPTITSSCAAPFPGGSITLTKQ